MIYASVEFPADRTRAAHLENDGWRLSGPQSPALCEMLDRLCGTDQFGPSDGDPVAAAAAAAAELLGGAVVHVREPEPVPRDAVF